MMLLLLLACGAEGGLDQPNPPPAPAPQLVNADPGVVSQTGVATEVHGPTRTFVLTGEGKRVIVHLRDTGTLRLGGKPSQVVDLVAGTTLWVEGKRQGDLLVVERAADAPDVDGPVDPVAAPLGVAPVEAPAAPADAAAPASPAAPASAPAPASPPAPDAPAPASAPTPG